MEYAGVKMTVREATLTTCALSIRALEHFAAYLDATKRPDARYLHSPEQLKRKQPEADVAESVKQAKRRA